MKIRKAGFTPLEIKKKCYDLFQRFRSKKRECSNVTSNLRSDVSPELSFTPTVSFWFASCFTKSETKRWGRAGFTLLELLIIIAIIGMLAGMIFPTLGKARIRARKAKVISELKTIELALMDYYTEYSGFPTNKGVLPADLPTNNGLNKLAGEEYLDTALRDAFDSKVNYKYYGCTDNPISVDDFADSCIVFSVGPNRIDDGAANFNNAHTDAYAGGTEPGSDNIYLIVPVEDIRYKK